MLNSQSMVPPNSNEIHILKLCLICGKVWYTVLIFSAGVNQPETGKISVPPSSYDVPDHTDMKKVANFAQYAPKIPDFQAEARFPRSTFVVNF